MPKHRKVLKGVRPTNQRGDETTKNEASLGIVVNIEDNLHFTIHPESQGGFTITTPTTRLTITINKATSTDTKDATDRSTNEQTKQTTVRCWLLGTTNIIWYLLAVVRSVLQICTDN